MLFNFNDILRIAIKQIPLYDENNVKYDVNHFINKIMPEVTYLIKFENDYIVKYYKNFAKNDFLYLITEYCEACKKEIETNLDCS